VLSQYPLPSVLGDGRATFPTPKKKVKNFKDYKDKKYIYCKKMLFFNDLKLYKRNIFKNGNSF